LQGTLDRLRAAQARNPERDFSVEINQTEASIAALGASIGRATMAKGSIGARRFAEIATSSSSTSQTRLR
jgi:hypothetical protein